MVSTDKEHVRKVFLSVVLVTLGTFIAPSFQRILGSRAWGLLGWTEAQWALFLAVRALVFIVFVLAAGVLGDFWGRRRIMLLTLGGFIVCLVASVVLPAGAMSMALQTPLSILGVMVRALAVTMVIVAVPDKRARLLQLIIYSAITGAASLLAPVITRELVGAVDLKWLYLPALVLTVAGFWRVKDNVPESRVTQGSLRNDGIALAVWTFGLSALVFAGILHFSIGWTHPIALTGLVLGAGLLLGLNWLSAVSKSRPWKFSLYYQRQLGVTLFAGIVLSTSLFAVLVQTYNFLYKVRDFSSVTAGIALAPFLIGAILVGSLVARMNARFGIRDSLAAGLVIVAIAAFGLYRLEPGLSYWVIMPFLILLGLGFVVGNATRLILLNDSVPLNLSATIQSIGSATAQLGSALAYSFMLTLIDRFASNAYADLLSASGLSSEAVSGRLTQLAANAETFPLVVSGQQQGQLLQSIEPVLQQAYVTGLSQAMLALAGTCLLCAVIVRVGLDARER